MASPSAVTRRSPVSGSNRRAVDVRRDLEPLGLDVGDAVDLVDEVDPGREARRREARVPRRGPEVEDLLARGEDAVAEEIGEHLAQPGAEGEHERPRADAAAVGQRDLRQPAARRGAAARPRSATSPPLFATSAATACTERRAIRAPLRARGSPTSPPRSRSAATASRAGRDRGARAGSRPWPSISTVARERASCSCAIHSTPVSWNSGAPPARVERAFHCSSDFQDQRV